MSPGSRRDPSKATTLQRPMPGPWWGSLSIRRCYGQLTAHPTCALHGLPFAMLLTHRLRPVHCWEEISALQLCTYFVVCTYVHCHVQSSFACRARSHYALLPPSVFPSAVAYPFRALANFVDQRLGYCTSKNKDKHDLECEHPSDSVMKKRPETITIGCCRPVCFLPTCIHPSPLLKLEGSKCHVLAIL